MQYGQPWCNDGVSVRNLQLQAPPHHALDAWGREKEQPVLLSVYLSFKSAFDSAAENDALDASTMHYGILAKALRGMKPDQSWGNLSQLSQLVHKTISDMLPGPDLLESLAIEIKMPKASLLGDAVVFHRHYASHSTQSMLHLVDICLPTLIGVNSNEREAKQKLIINAWVGGLADQDCDTYTKLEQTLTKVCNSATHDSACSPNPGIDYRSDQLRDSGVTRIARPAKSLQVLCSTTTGWNQHQAILCKAPGRPVRRCSSYRRLQNFQTTTCRCSFLKAITNDTSL